MDLFQWQIPFGPGDPFGTTILAILDSLRVGVATVGLLTVLICVPALLMTWSITQKFRIASIGLFSVYVSLTEIQRIGDYANWRLILGTVCVIWAFSSLIAFIQYEGNPDHAPRYARWLLRKASSRKEVPGARQD